VSERPTWARWVTRISLAVAIAALVWTIRDIGLRTLGDYLHRIGWWWIAILVFECTWHAARRDRDAARSCRPTA